jgi:hypothetical protein
MESRRDVFARRYARIALDRPATLRVVGSPAHLGRMLDLSLGGASITLPTRLDPETFAVLEILDEQASAGASSARCVVRSVEMVRDPAGGRSFRHGVSFLSASGELHALVEVQATPAPQTLGPEHALQPTGRELLFQASLEQLALRQFRVARRLALQALKGDPRNANYLALVHRVNAEEALAAGRTEEARTEGDRALARLPGDRELQRLAQEIRRARLTPLARLAQLFRVRGALARRGSVPRA